MGNFATTVADDFRIIDGVETITYTATRVLGGVETTTTFTVTSADPHDYTQQEIVALQGFFNAGDREWGIGARLFPAGVLPQRGDTITQGDGTVWQIIEGSHKDPFGVSWFIPSRRARVNS